MKKSVLLRASFALCGLLTVSASAELRIEVTKGVDNALRVGVVPFVMQGSISRVENPAGIVVDDLRLSGRFDPLDQDLMLSFPGKPEDVIFRDWRLLGQEYLVVGEVTRSRGRLRMSFALVNVLSGKTEVQQTIEGRRNEVRDLAHHVSDVVYERLTGVPGVFSTQIMYVTSSGTLEKPEFALNLADADGHRARTLFRSSEPILSPAWSPDGSRIVYVSFERDAKSAIYLRDLQRNTVELLTNSPGLNSAPSFSPDGSRLVMTLSRDGNPEIYMMELSTRSLQRLTRHYAIDTEPSFTPDGNKVIFTSSRGGKPQIYQLTLGSMEIDRLTLQGDYNARARLLPDGSGLVYVHRKDGIFHIALKDMTRNRVSILTETELDESPSVAPNGSMLLYATQYDGRGILAAVAVDGGVKFRLPSSAGNVREPAWSPHKRRSYSPIQE